MVTTFLKSKLRVIGEINLSYYNDNVEEALYQAYNLGRQEEREEHIRNELIQQIDYFEKNKSL